MGDNTTYQVVWNTLLGGGECLASGLSREAAEVELENLNKIAPLPPLGGHYAIEPEEAE